MPYYTIKPIVIEARQYFGTPESAQEIIQWASSYNVTIELWVDATENHLEINTLEGIMAANPGDYIIKGITNEFYPVKPDIFEETHALL